MTRKAFTVFGILAILMVTIFGTVAAQDETPETPPPPTDTVLPGSTFFTHPVVKLLSGYFDRETEEPEEELPVDEEIPGDPEDPADPEEVETPEPDESESGLGPIGEEIAAYHEDGMGFGVLVKIYAMVEASEEACAVEGDVVGEEGCTPLTADELVTAFNSGTGMGTLFKEHGKPALLGVGHVKQELKKLENQPVEEVEDSEELEDSEDTELDPQADKKNNKPEKVKKDKTNNGKGPNK